VRVSLIFAIIVSFMLLFRRISDYVQTDRQTDELIWGGLGNLRFLQVNIFLIAPSPPPLITPDEEYDLMSNEVRNRILGMVQA